MLRWQVFAQDRNLQPEIAAYIRRRPQAIDFREAFERDSRRELAIEDATVGFVLDVGFSGQGEEVHPIAGLVSGWHLSGLPRLSGFEMATDHRATRNITIHHPCFRIRFHIKGDILFDCAGVRSIYDLFLTPLQASSGIACAARDVNIAFVAAAERLNTKAGHWKTSI